MVNQAYVRIILRCIHIATGIFLVGYVYKFHGDPNATRVAQLVVVPAIGASGLLLWQHGRIVGWWRSTASQTSAGRG